MMLTDVEDQNAPEHLADGRGDGFLWVGRLAGGDTDPGSVSTVQG